ncbi:MAG: tetratricopeptide repeat protein [Planctomycetes bacterium]|nr:tetratricopeptide repeat protein [Planctomycetota bacterium]
MAVLSDYSLSADAMPSFSGQKGSVSVGALPRETGAMEAVRKRFEKILEEARAECPVGGETAAELLEATAGFRAAQEGNLERAEKSLSAALARWSMAWMEEELRIARYRVRFARGDFAGAVEDAEALAARCPDSIDAYSLLGYGLFALSLAPGGEADHGTVLDRSITAYGEAIRRAPFHPLSRIGRAMALHARSRLETAEDRAIALLREAVADLDALEARAPGSADLLANRGFVRSDLAVRTLSAGGDAKPLFAAVMSDFEAALAKRPDDAETRLKLGWARWTASQGSRPDPRTEEEECRRAVALLEEGLRAKPDSADARLTLGSASRRLGALAEAGGRDPKPFLEAAVRAFEEVGRARPDDPKVPALLGEALLAAGKAELERGPDARATLRKAAGILEEAVRRDPPSIDVRNQAGIAWTYLAQAELAAGADPGDSCRKAVAHYDEILRKTPRLDVVHFNKGNALRHAAVAGLRGFGKDPGLWLEAALAAYGQVLVLDPSKVEARWWRADLLGGFGRFEEAAAELRAAIPLAGDKAPFLKERLEAAEAGVRRFAWLGRAREAKALMDTGDYAGALPRFDKVLDEAVAAGAGPDPRDRHALAFFLYDHACLLAVASEGKAGPRAEARPVAPADAAALRAKAVASLRRAFECGWTDLEHVRKDSDLDALRKMPEFQALMEEWKGKAGKVPEGK